MSKKVYLITGAAGFIGSNFVHYLFGKEKDIEVRVLDKLCYSANLKNLKVFEGQPNFKFIEGDICNKETVKEAMEGANVVVNFAAETAVDRSIESPESFLYTDIVGVYTLLEEARKQKDLKKFIQISTDEVYGQILEGSSSMLWGLGKLKRQNLSLEILMRLQSWAETGLPTVFLLRMVFRWL